MSTAKWLSNVRDQPEVLRRRIEHLHQIRGGIVDDRTISAVDSLIAEAEGALDAIHRAGRS